MLGTHADRGEELPPGRHTSSGEFLPQLFQKQQQNLKREAALEKDPMKREAKKHTSIWRSVPPSWHRRQVFAVPCTAAVMALVQSNRPGAARPPIGLAGDCRNTVAEPS